MKIHQKKSFTLAEVLTVVVIIAVLSLSLYRSLAVGIKVFQRSQQFSAQEDIMIFFDKLSMDLRNAFDFSLFDFAGTSSRTAFSTIVSVPMGIAGQNDVEVFSPQIGRVEYGFDAVNKTIYRRTANYGQAINGDFGSPRVLASSINRLHFEYLKYGMKGLAERKLGQDLLPSAVEVTVYYQDGNGEEKTLTRLINVPLHS